MKSFLKRFNWAGFICTLAIGMLGAATNSNVKEIISIEFAILSGISFIMATALGIVTMKPKA